MQSGGTCSDDCRFPNDERLERHRKRVGDVPKKQKVVDTEVINVGSILHDTLV